MAEAADIGANFSSYVGNAGSVGGNFGVVEINTKPLENIAAYAVLFNRNKWEREKQETDANIAKLADLSKIELNSLRGKDKEQAIGEFAELQKKATDYARKIARTPQEKMQNELDWQLELRAFNDNYNSGKRRAVTYAKRRNDILMGTQDAKAKDAEISILDKEFDDTGIGTEISGVANFKVGTVDVPTPTAQKINSVIIGANENVAVDGTIYNPKTNAGIADATILNIKKLYPKAGTPEFNLLSEAEKNQAKIQSTIDSGGKVWVDATDPLNSVLKNYISAEGVFDAKRFENENASNTTLMNAYNALKIYDSYNRQKYEQASTGMFSDKGLNVKLPDNINPEDFKVGFVDFANGVTANQLVQSGMFAKYTGDTFTKKVTETDNAIQRANIGQNYAALNETIRHNKATENLNSGELKLNEDKWKASQTGGTTQINGAMERAKRIYSDMQKLADKNGVISPDKLRQLNVEQLKYLGIEAPEQRDEAGKIITAAGFKPLSFDEVDNKGKAKNVPYAIQLINGEVRVLRGAAPIEGGKYRGEFVPGKSTNLYNIGTNILNEELKNSGAKELNSYLGVDVIGGTVATVEGGSTTVSGGGATKTSTSATVNLNELDPNGFKKEGNNYRYKDGTLFDAKGNIVKPK